MLLGHWQEMKALGQAQDALAALADLLPDDAERVRPDGTVEIGPRSRSCLSATSCSCGPVVGSRPTATSIEGEAEVDESMITGESRPVPKQSATGWSPAPSPSTRPLRVHVDAVGDDTALAGIQRLVAEAQASRSRAQALADRSAAMLFYVAAIRDRDHVRRVDGARQRQRAIQHHGHRLGRSPARTHSGSQSRWLSASPRPLRRAPASSSRIGSRSSGCGASRRCCLTRPAR